MKCLQWLWQELRITLDVSLEREIQGKGIWRSVLIPISGIASPAEYFYRGPHSSGTSAGFVVLMGKKILSFISSAK